jgi:hypothetical protein
MAALNADGDPIGIGATAVNGTPDSPARLW